MSTARRTGLNAVFYTPTANVGASLTTARHSTGNCLRACVPRMRREVTACERRDRQSNAVQEMEEGADGPLLALRDQLCERGIPNHCKGRRLRAGVLSVAGKGRGTPVRYAPRS